MGVSRHRSLVVTATVLLLASCAAGSGARTTTVSVGPDLRFSVQVSDTDALRRAGLAGRGSLPEGTGMLFTYQDSAPRSYWMADMLVPIDLAWIRAGRVLEVQTLQPCVPESECPSVGSPGPVDAVLEVGADALDGVAPGTTVTVHGG